MTETGDFPAMMCRMLAAWAQRVAAADTYDLREMVDVLGIGSPAVASTVRMNREAAGPWSWGEIGDALGITRQAAQQRFRVYREDRVA
jgi:hypothetical protein